MQESLKSKAIKAVIWNAFQRYGSLIIAFLTNIVLARLLSPDDFGVIGVLTVFIAVASAITDSGFNSALIQRKEVVQIDYCTVFYWNISISILLVGILCVASPYISAYFNKPLLKNIIRVESIVLVVNSLCIVQQSILMKYLKFKLLAIRTIISTLISSIIGIVLAIMEFGVWALVWQGVINSVCSAVLLWHVSEWRPKLLFSWISFKGMFKFGSCIFISSICNTIYTNIQSFIIGKAFSIKDLGYYTQAKKLETVPVDGTASVLNTVLFPVYASVADDRVRHKKIVRKNVNIITYLTFPLMVVLILIARPLIILLFTNKWEISVPMFQILCVGGMITPLNMANTEIFRSIGAGGIYLTLQTIKRIVGIGIILCFIPFGLYALLWGTTFVGIVTYLLNLVFTHKYFNYTIIEQLKDIFPNLLLTAVCGIIIKFLMTYMCMNNYYDIIWIPILYYVLFFTCSFIFKLKGAMEMKELLLK